MTQLISPGSSHWYEHFNGVFKPCHQVPKKDGSGPRATTITDARRMHLFPSVSAINGVVSEPGLNSWKLTQAILSALTLYRPIERYEDYRSRCFRELGQGVHDPGQVIGWGYSNQPRLQLTDDEFAAKVVLDMEAQSEKAKALGTEMHSEISGFLDSRLYDPQISEEPKRLSRPAKEWLIENAVTVHGVEQIVGSLEHGYAGTLDLDCELKAIGPAVVDYKSQNVKRNGNGPKPVFYTSWGKQLAAYAMASKEPGNDKALVSLIIDKNNNGEVHVKVWDNPGALWQQFLHSAAIWRFENNYDPREIYSGERLRISYTDDPELFSIETKQPN